MSTLEVFFLLFLLFAANASNRCSISTCSTKGMPIRFPFQLQGQKHCGYPGFNLSCSNQSTPVLELPFSGEFFVRDISYRSKLIALYDPANCLPRRLQTLNLSETPFTAAFLRNYTFLGCPSQLTESQHNGIRCLGNSTYSVLATSSTRRAKSMSHTCQVIARFPIPVTGPVDLEEDDFTTLLNNDLQLIWDEPDCGDCEEQGGMCGFLNETSQEIGCFYDVQPGKTDGGLLVFRIIVIAIGLLAMLCATGIAFFICLIDKRRNNNTQQVMTAPEPEPDVIETGLDEVTIESYKKIVLGESKRVPGPNNSTCPICLSEYHSKETIRCMPECEHCFHVVCIDEWLHKHNSCPVCRNSPSPNYV